MYLGIEAWQQDQEAESYNLQPQASGSIKSKLEVEWAEIFNLKAHPSDMMASARLYHINLPKQCHKLRLEWFKFPR